MLSQLYIKNVAVISEATISFSQGLNAFTGETGAGKTILINAINAVLGERMSKDLIRTGEKSAVISALFSGVTPEMRQALEQAGFSSEEDDVLLYREINIDGKSICKVDGRPATLGIIKSLAPLFINIHGQHDNQQLLSPQKHIAFIDSYGELGEQIAAYKSVYQAYIQTKNELKELNTDDAEKERQMDLLRYQIQEIEEASLIAGEEEELRAQQKLIQNAVNVTSALGGSVDLLDGSDDVNGLVSGMNRLMQLIAEASQYFEQAEPMADKISDLYYELEALSGDVHELLDGFDCDASQLDDIEDRLDTIYKLKRKYGDSIEEILRYYEQACERLEKIETSEERALALQKRMEQQLAQAKKLAQALSKARMKASDAFVEAVQQELRFLDMPTVKISVNRQEKALSADGFDDIELFIATNVGETPKSLSKTASGGELSRVMLSIKNVLAHREQVQTMIFDEVDTGVSGRAAQKIGQKLAQVAQNRQVIVVTHLAQVACFAQNHLLISKTARDDRTYTSITPLTRTQRIQEIARINAGDKISELALRHAEEMLQDAGN